MDLSVVVASFSGEAALGRCLESLMPECGAAEVIVACREGDGWGLANRFKTVRFLCGARGASVFDLRALGVKNARRGLVALLEDHCCVASGWGQALLDAWRADHPVVGGVVDSDPRGAYDHALYLCEYGPHMPPLPEGPTPSLSGVNAAYDRALLERVRPTWENGFYENEVHDALHREVAGLHRAARALVTSHLSLPLGVALDHLFRGGHRYGRHRRRLAPPLLRALLPLGSLLVPAVLLARLVRVVAMRRPSRLPATLFGLPYLLLLIGAWSAGEALGYVEPGARTPERA